MDVEGDTEKKSRKQIKVYIIFGKGEDGKEIGSDDKTKKTKHGIRRTQINRREDGSGERGK